MGDFKFRKYHKIKSVWLSAYKEPCSLQECLQDLLHSLASEEARDPQIQQELLELMGLEYFFFCWFFWGFLTCLHITSQFCLLQWVFSLLGEGYGGILGKLCNWILCYWGCILSCDCFNEVKNSFMYSLLACSISNSKAQWSGFISLETENWYNANELKLMLIEDS